MTTCKAHNCPCGEYQKRLCRYHIDADAKDWPFVSFKLNENRPFLTAIQWSLTTDRYKEDTLTAMLGEMYLHLHPKDGEAQKVWAYRALDWLSRECRPIRYGEAARKLKLSSDRKNWNVRQ